MRPDDITPETVHQALRAIRVARPLTDSPLLQLDAVTEGLRAERIADSPSSRSAYLQTWLEGITREQLGHVRGSDAQRGGRLSDTGAAMDNLRADFKAASVDREAWGALHFHYFTGSSVKLREAASSLGLGYNTVRRRIDRGYQLLAAVLQAAEQAAASGAASGRTVPRPLTRFIGRDLELGAVRALMAEHRLVTLTGPGGIGKSRLAIHLAQDLAADYPDGATFVEVVALTDDRQVPQAVLSALGLREAPGRSTIDILAGYLADKRMLLVVDNCEHVVGASSALIRELLTRTAGLQVLATSREELSVDGAVAWTVPPMALPPDDAATSAASLMHYDATRLFGTRAAAALTGQPLTDAAAAQVARICARLEGIPLAIELAAARTRQLSLDQLEARLEDRFAVLKDGRHAARPGHETLWSAMDWSFDLLTRPEQQLLARLTVFRGGWTLEAAEAVCSGDGVAEGDVLALLAQLDAKSLVYRRDSGAATRFTMLETVRQHAADRTAGIGGAGGALDRHLSYFADLAVTAASAWRGPGQEVWWARLLADDANLHAAMTYAAAGGGVRTGMRLGAALTGYWIRRGQLVEGEATLRLLAESASDHRSPEYAQLQCSAADLAIARGDYRRANGLAEEALSVADAVGERLIALRSRRLLSIARFELGERAATVDDMRNVAGLMRDAGDHLGEADCLHSLGCIASLLGEVAQSRAYWEGALALFLAHGNARSTLSTRERLGNLAYWCGDLVVAEAHVSASLATCGNDDRSPFAGFQHRLAGNISLLRGDTVAARAHLQAARIIAGDVRNPALEATTIRALGELEAQEGDFDRARKQFRASLQVALESGRKNAAIAATGMLLEIAVTSGDLVAARQYLADCASLHDAWESDPEMTWYSGLIDRMSGNIEGAIEKSSRALRAYWRDGNNRIVVDMLFEVAELAMAMQQPERAARLTGAALEHWARMGIVLSWFHRPAAERLAQKLLAAIGEAGLAGADEAGRALSLAEAVAYALDEAPWDALSEVVAARLAAGEPAIVAAGSP